MGISVIERQQHVVIRPLIFHDPDQRACKIAKLIAEVIPLFGVLEFFCQTEELISSHTLLLTEPLNDPKSYAEKYIHVVHFGIQ